MNINESLDKVSAEKQKEIQKFSDLYTGRATVSLESEVTAFLSRSAGPVWDQRYVPLLKSGITHRVYKILGPRVEM